MNCPFSDSNPMKNRHCFFFHPGGKSTLADQGFYLGVISAVLMFVLVVVMLVRVLLMPMRFVLRVASSRSVTRAMFVMAMRMRMPVFPSLRVFVNVLVLVLTFLPLLVLVLVPMLMRVLVRQMHIELHAFNRLLLPSPDMQVITIQL